MCRLILFSYLGTDSISLRTRLNRIDPEGKFTYSLTSLLTRLGRVGLVNLLFCTNSLGLAGMAKDAEENNYINRYTKIRFVIILY